MVEVNKYRCRFYEDKYPNVGEVVIIKITKITDLGVYVELLEYANTEGLIVVGELSKKRFKNVAGIVKLGKIEAANVLRVDKDKGYIDLSRKKVQSYDAERCLKKYSRAKIAHNVMAAASKKLGINIIDLYEKFAFEKARENNSLYNYFLTLLNESQEKRKLEDQLEKINLNEKEKEKREVTERAFEDVKTEDILDVMMDCVVRKFNIAKYKVRADIEIICPTIDGVEDIKQVLKKAKKFHKKIEINLSRLPTYTICITSEERDTSLTLIAKVCKYVQDEISKIGGCYKMNSEPQIYGDKGNIEMLCSKFDELYGDALEDELNESSDC